jgi:hypothetical protein
VRQHWDAIERVAAALLDRGELSGDEVDALLDMAQLLDHLVGECE